MQLARVIGDVVATRKDPNFDSTKLLIVQPLGADGLPTGRSLVAVDSVGAGIGENVFTSDFDVDETPSKMGAITEE